jgi:anti-sigma factor RsiW
MKSCEAFLGLLHAYLDGELVGEDLASFELHGSRCEACRRGLESERAMAKMIARSWPRPQTPPELRERIDLLLKTPRFKGKRFWLGAAAAAAVVLLGSTVVFWGRTARLAGEKESRPPEFAALAADTHLRYSRGQLPLEVNSPQPESVARWFEGRVPFHVTLPDYPLNPGESKPYRLMGGRLVSFRGDYAAYVVYRLEERPISLLVTSASQVLPSGGERVAFGSLVFHQEAVAGLKVITWTDKGLTYALASDLAVSGERSCMVCHGSLEERRRIEGFSTSGM